ncbi:MAG: hypothetical protein KAV87_51340 [Desulfobacteraceae bacterium]|nr:hypothetical protein [Desulfobacteraceae bacterium]
MLGIVGKIFGSDKALSAVVNGVSNGLDKLVYTSEEKADDAAKDRADARAMVITWMESTKGQNIARRLIALAIVSVWLFQYMACMALSVAAIWVNPAMNAALISSARIIGTFAERMNGAVMLILGFYFAAPYMGSLVKGAMDKFAGRPRAD